MRIGQTVTSNVGVLQWLFIFPDLFHMDLFGITNLVLLSLGNKEKNCTMALINHTCQSNISIQTAMYLWIMNNLFLNKNLMGMAYILSYIKTFAN